MKVSIILLIGGIGICITWLFVNWLFKDISNEDIHKELDGCKWERD